MKLNPFTRRAALGSGLLFGSSLAFAQPLELLKLLLGPDAIETIKKCIADGLDYHIEDRTFLENFYLSLLSGMEHSRSAEDFQELLATKNQEEALAIYVIQEFFVSSNYYELVSGQADKLIITGK